MKTFVINLNKDTERMSFMQKQLEFLEISFDRFSAIHGKEYGFGDEYDEAKAVIKNGKSLSLGELGCALSHRQIYEKIINENIDYALVFEDDIEIQDILPINFKEIIKIEIEKNENKKLSQKWEYVSFDYPKPGIFFIKHYFVSLILNYNLNIKQKSILNKIKYLAVSFIKYTFVILMSTFEGVRNFIFLNIFKKGKALNFYRPLYFAGCYLITNSGAKKLLEISNPIVYAADRVQNRARVEKNLKFKAFCPLVVDQKREKFKSNIGI